jgi:hypothetical protein
MKTSLANVKARSGGPHVFVGYGCYTNEEIYSIFRGKFRHEIPGLMGYGSGPGWPSIKFTPRGIAFYGFGYEA